MASQPFRIRRILPPAGALGASLIVAFGCSSEQPPATPSPGVAGGAAVSGAAGSTPLGTSGTGGAGTGAGGAPVAAQAGEGGSAAHGGGVGGAAGAPLGGARMVSWETKTLSTEHIAEGADVGDIDGDGQLDLVAGPVWYRGPTFAPGGTLVANPPALTVNQYSKFFLTFVDDVNGDGRADVIGIGDAGGGNGTGTPNAFWYENPGPAGLAQPWARQPVFDGLVSNESPAYLSLVGDARKELVFMTERALGYAERGADAGAPWSFTSVSGQTTFNTPYVHGLGAGDIDGDGLVDILERAAWWRQVAAGAWERHPVDFAMGANKADYGNWGGAQMHAFDVDGDGDNDVVTSLAAHQYGLSWFEQRREGTSITFTAHAILPATPAGDNVSQLHAVSVADVNGDGLTDVIAGKRYYAHPASNPDPGTEDAPILAWFELQREASGARFVEHVIHDDSGAGCNFVAADLNQDGKVDIFTTNKRGTFVHLQR